MQYVPTWPAISARIDASGTASVTMNGTEHRLETTTAEDARREVVRLCTETAQKLQRPVRVTVEEPDATWPLLVHPDGRVDSVTDAPGDDETTTPSPDTTAGVSGPRRTSHIPVVPGDGPSEAPSPAGDSPGEQTPGPHDPGIAPTVQVSPAEPPVPQAPPVPPGTAATPPAAPAAIDDAPAPLPFPLQDEPEPAMPIARQISPQSRHSFIAPEHGEEPATRGWRGALARAGLRIPPNASERTERDDQALVSQHWTGPRTIAVVNGKGGANKTPTTILTAAVFARYGGAGVLAWDNNQTRGTLGWRTEQGPHEATLHDLLPETEKLLAADAQSAELAQFMHHQTRDHYDVLRSQPMALASQQRVSSHDVDRVHAVAAKYYRLVVMDSGNDESDPMWLRMIDHTDQLVVATSSRAEHAEAGALLLEALAERDEHSAQLARNAVAVVSQSDDRTSSSEVSHIAQGYSGMVREVTRIPYDPGMGAAQLHYRALRPETQRAWLATAAAIARGLSR